MNSMRRCASVRRDEFGDRHWDREPLLTRHHADFTDLLSLADVDSLLSQRALRTPFFRMAKHGALVPPAQYTGSGGPGAEIADQVVDERVFALLGEGATLVLQGLHRLWPPLMDFATGLRADLGTPVQINAYLTPPGSRGFSTHYDTHAVFVLQVAGRKRWTIHPPVVTDPIERRPWGARAGEVSAVTHEAPFLDAVLDPGDTLYLPRGWLHAAGTLDALSLHLPVGLRATTRATLVEALLNLAADEPSLRAGLPMGLDTADPDALAPAFADTVKALHAWLDTLTAQDVARFTTDRPGPLRPLAQLAARAALTADSRVMLRPGLQFRLMTGESLTVQLPDKAISMPSYCAAAVRTVLDGRPHRVGDLPGLDPEDCTVLIGRLLGEAVVVPA